MSDSTVQIGFIPLVDCALMAIAQECGHFAKQGLRVELRKAQSWSQIQEKTATGEFSAAHMLITMPLHSALGNLPGTSPFSYAFTLSRNGNGIILANAFWNWGVRDAAGLARWRTEHPGLVLRLGVVHPRGTQEYMLRSWLARGGLDIGPGIELRIIPPQEMVGRLRQGEVDGFCVGEPWSRRAAASKLGRIVAESVSLLPGLGEKVLGVKLAWHRDHPEVHARILRALASAARWLADAANFDAAVEIVSSKHYVNTQKSVVAAALRDAGEEAGGEAVAGESGVATEITRFLSDDCYAPARSHAQWYAEQMLRWGHAEPLSTARLDFSSLCLEQFYHDSVRRRDPAIGASGPAAS